jgi:hypothetical protein
MQMLIQKDEPVEIDNFCDFTARGLLQKIAEAQFSLCGNLLTLILADILQSWMGNNFHKMSKRQSRKSLMEI